MNKRIRSKKRAASVDPVQAAWDIVAERLAETGSITFFVEPAWGSGGGDRFHLNSTKGFNLVSKKVRKIN